MRLLDTRTQKLRDFAKLDDIPPYAILSHTRGIDEVQYHDVTTGKAKDRDGYAKIVGPLLRSTR